MIPATFNVRDRGPTPRGMKKAYNAASKQAWFETGVHFHSQMMDRRFTQAHATLAGYTPRSRKYQLRKLRKFGHTRPLEYSGTARRSTRTANITSTSQIARVRYPGARVFNFRNPNSEINMVDEFTRVIPKEADELAAFYDKELDQELNADDSNN